MHEFMAIDREDRMRARFMWMGGAGNMPCNPPVTGTWMPVASHWQVDDTHRNDPWPRMGGPKRPREDTDALIEWMRLRMDFNDNREPEVIAEEQSRRECAHFRQYAEALLGAQLLAERRSQIAQDGRG